MNPIIFIHRDKKKNLKYPYKWTLHYKRNIIQIHWLILFLGYKFASYFYNISDLS